MGGGRMFSLAVFRKCVPTARTVTRADRFESRMSNSAQEPFAVGSKYCSRVAPDEVSNRAVAHVRRPPLFAGAHPFSHGLAAGAVRAVGPVSEIGGSYHFRSTTAAGRGVDNLRPVDLDIRDPAGLRWNGFLQIAFDRSGIAVHRIHVALRHAARRRVRLAADYGRSNPLAWAHAIRSLRGQSEAGE